MIINPFSSIPIHPKSHVRGWSQHWANTLGTTIAKKSESYDNCESLYLDHGVNYSGGLNLFGGVTDEVFDRLKNLSESNSELYSLDIDMPDYGLMLSKRIGQATCHNDLPLIIEKLNDKFKSSKTITQYDIDAKHIAIGDSHATSYALSNSAVIKKNGQTLYGALKSGFINDALDKTKKGYESITLCLGSIDVRHHLCRLDDPLKELRDILDDYIALAKETALKHGGECYIAAPHPVEYECRRIPKTGFYKGSAYYGSLSRRKDLVDFFIDYIETSGVKCVHQPNQRYHMDPEHYANEYMELGSSVHLSPIHYRSVSDWGM
jgi:hypothetical protein